MRVKLKENLPFLNISQNLTYSMFRDYTTFTSNYCSAVNHIEIDHILILIQVLIYLRGNNWLTDHGL